MCDDPRQVICGVGLYDLEKNYMAKLDSPHIPPTLKEYINLEVKAGGGPIGCGYHDATGWFIICSGQGPFIAWTAKEDGWEKIDEWLANIKRDLEKRNAFWTKAFLETAQFVTLTFSVHNHPEEGDYVIISGDGEQKIAEGEDVCEHSITPKHFMRKHILRYGVDSISISEDGKRIEAKFPIAPYLVKQITEDICRQSDLG